MRKHAKAMIMFDSEDEDDCGRPKEESPGGVVQ